MNTPLRKYITSAAVIVVLATALYLPQTGRQVMQTPRKSPTGKLLIVSDIHFNPFCYPSSSLINALAKTDATGWAALFESYKDSSYGVPGKDTYYPLLKSAINAMKAQNSNPDMIIINGDFLSHYFQNTYLGYQLPPDSMQSFISKTIRFIFLCISNDFPNTPVLSVLGNNDAYCDDYDIQPNDPFLHFFATQCAPMLHGVQQQDSFMATFSKGGYYMVSMPWDTTQVFIGLNTIFFSGSYENDSNLCTNTMDHDTTGGPAELAWLSNALGYCAATHKKVWMSYHIPPGIDVYSSSSPCTGTGMWKNWYNNTFLAIISKYSDIINANFAAHTHMDDFRLIGPANAATVSFIHIAPSVSPNHDNNPAFQEITWDPHNMTLINCTTYMFKGLASRGNNTWPLEYDYDAKYNIAAINPQTLTGIWDRISNDATVRNNYFKYYFVSNGTSTPRYWQPYWCGIRQLQLDTFKKCNCSK